MKRTLLAATALATATLVAGCVSTDRSSSPDQGPGKVGFPQVKASMSA